MKNLNVNVFMGDKVCGTKSYENTTNELIKGGWELYEDDIEAIENGEKIRLISPNGRIVINITRINPLT